MVVFEAGQPNTSQYRIFNIKGKDSPDDTAMVKEILERRFNHSEWAKPDLILIDGGKGQINAARSVVHETIPIISLAKGPKRTGTHVFATTRPTKVDMDKLSQETQNLIRHIDAEAHRFAIKQYRKLHRKTLR